MIEMCSVVEQETVDQNVCKPFKHNASSETSDKFWFHNLPTTWLKLNFFYVDGF